ncbi:MAG TPA: site-specific integrase [Conexibacter sp.]
MTQPTRRVLTCQRTRLPGTGRLLIRRSPDGSETYYGTWYANGRRLKRRIGPRRGRNERAGGLTERQAEDKLRRLIADTEVQAPVSDRMTIVDLGALYIRNAERRGRKKGTLLDIDSDIRVHLEPFFGRRPIDTFDYNGVIDLMGALERKDLAPKDDPRHTPHALGAVQLRHRPAAQIAHTNPCTGVEMPAVPDPQEVRFLTLEEIDQMLAAVRPGMFEHIDRPMFMAAVMTGMRKGELVALRWRDVDFHAARICVRRNYSCGEFGTPKTRRSTRSIPMTAELAHALLALRAISRWCRPDDLVFAHPEHGGVIPKANIARRFRAALKAGGVDESHRFHDLRHTFGTHMAAAAVPMRTLQEWMGHRDLTTTQRYADYAPSAHEGEMVAAAFARSEPVA